MLRLRLRGGLVLPKHPVPRSLPQLRNLVIVSRPTQTLSLLNKPEETGFCDFQVTFRIEVLILQRRASVGDPKPSKLWGLTGVRSAFQLSLKATSRQKPQILYPLPSTSAWFSVIISASIPPPEEENVPVFHTNVDGRCVLNTFMISVSSKTYSWP